MNEANERERYQQTRTCMRMLSLKEQEEGGEEEVEEGTKECKSPGRGAMEWSLVVPLPKPGPTGDGTNEVWLCMSRFDRDWRPTKTGMKTGWIFAALGQGWPRYPNSYLSAVAVARNPWHSTTRTPCDTPEEDLLMTANAHWTTCLFGASCLGFQRGFAAEWPVADLVAAVAAPDGGQESGRLWREKGWGILLCCTNNIGCWVQLRCF